MKGNNAVIYFVVLLQAFAIKKLEKHGLFASCHVRKVNNHSCYSCCKSGIN